MYEIYKILILLDYKMILYHVYCIIFAYKRINITILFILLLKL